MTLPDARVELYIDHIAGVTENKAIFDALAAEREAIPGAFVNRWSLKRPFLRLCSYSNAHMRVAAQVAIPINVAGYTTVTLENCVPVSCLWLLTLVSNLLSFTIAILCS